MKLYTKKMAMLLLGTCLLSSDFCYASGGAGSGRGAEHLLGELVRSEGRRGAHGRAGVDFTIPSGDTETTVSAKGGVSLAPRRSAKYFP